MTILYKNEIDFRIPPNEHPYLNGAWTPCREEVDAVDMEVIGEIPKDISGIYVRNTENPVHEAIGIYHPFDGDGMVHAMSFHNGQAKYSNRFVRTKGLQAETEAFDAGPRRQDAVVEPRGDKDLGHAQAPFHVQVPPQHEHVHDAPEASD